MNAILVGTITSQDRYDWKDSLDELADLAKTLGIHPIHRITQKIEKPNNKTYIGSGKLNEIWIAVHTHNIEIVIFDDELSPTQLRNIQDFLEIEIMDRSYLILKIFEQRASTKEAKLQINLAKDLYLLPRLSFLREKESRIGGTSGSLATRGAGETQKELDRRHLMAEIYRIKEELKQIKTMKLSQIEKRKKNDIPVVALVGYTNAGKSSTMNSILQYTDAENKSVLEKDQLFATLQTYNKKIEYDKKSFILVDTIGFVSKLPHHLIESFYQTLQEVKNADLILHIIDSSNSHIQQQYQVVCDVLYQLGITDIPTIFVFTKWDKTINSSMEIVGKKNIMISNKTKYHIPDLIKMIVEEISPSTIHSSFLIPYTEGQLISLLETQSKIYQKEYQDYGIFYDVELPIKLYSKFKIYDLDLMVS